MGRSILITEWGRLTMIRVRILATGQVIDLVPAAAVEKLNSGLAVLVREETTREFFGGSIGAVIQTAARYIRQAVR